MDVAAKEWNMRAARAIIRQHRYAVNHSDHDILALIKRVFSYPTESGKMMTIYWISMV
jgi:hypothetical protein